MSKWTHYIWPKRLTHQIIVVMAALFAILVCGAISYWLLEGEPKLRIQEQTKVDLLMASNIIPIEHALDRRDYDELQEYLDQLLLLNDPGSGQHLIEGIVIEILDETVIAALRDDLDVDGFVAEAALFSNDEERSMRGLVRFYYTNAFYDQAKREGLRTLIAICLFFLVLLAVVIGLLEYLLQPLRYIVNALRSVSSRSHYELPDISSSRSEDVELLKIAMKEMLKTVQENTDLLEQHVRERTDELATAKEAAEAASYAKSEFLANMSHEIRTPMHAIVGLTELSLQHETSPKLQDYLRTIKGASRSLLGIINDILDFSKIEAGKLDIESTPFQLDELLDSVCDIFREIAVEKGVELIVVSEERVPRTLIGDSLRLGQVLTNLLSNAVKFTEIGEVELHVDVSELSSSEVTLQFSVRDSGIGIPADKVETLFEAFSQADTSTTRKYGGTGLGLTISSRLIALMHGQLKVESSAGSGSCFFFSLSLDYRNDPLEKPHLCPDQIRGLKTLVVDDNETVRVYTSELLRAFGFDVDAVSSGKGALDLLSSKRSGFGLIMLDWKMADMDGIETLKRLRSMPHHKKTPVVMMTAFGNNRERDQAEKIGVNAFLRKPFRQPVLYSTVAEALSEESALTVNSAQELAKEALELERNLKGSHVLLVEDNRINQKVSFEILNAMGVIVEIVDSGEEALSAVQQRSYDAVLMDVQMPGMSGLEATVAIREKGVKFPVIAMTANAMIGDREACLDSGMDDYVSKPIDAGVLYSVLSQWIHCGASEARSKSDTAEHKSGYDMELPVIDIEKALTGMGGDKGLLAETLQDFVDLYADAGGRIEAAISEARYHDAEIIAHTLKGLGATFAAAELNRSAAAMEQALRHEDLDRLDELLTELKAAIDQMLTTIGKFLNR